MGFGESKSYHFRRERISLFQTPKKSCFPKKSRVTFDVFCLAEFLDTTQIAQGPCLMITSCGFGIEHMMWNWTCWIFQWRTYKKSGLEKIHLHVIGCGSEVCGSFLDIKISQLFDHLTTWTVSYTVFFTKTLDAMIVSQFHHALLLGDGQK